MTKPEFSLDGLTLTEVQPVELIKAADEAGFDFVSLYVQPPPIYASTLVCAANERDCARALADAKVRAMVLEVFDLHSIATVESFREAFERGARLGASTAVAINHSNRDRGQSADLLARMAEIARECGLGVDLEPVVGGSTATLQQGAELIAASGRDVGLVFDAWHVVGAGDDTADIDAVDRSLIRYVQLCDGPMPMTFHQWMSGVVSERLYPGDGEFPLSEMLRLMPEGVPIGIEAPSLSRAQTGRSPLEQAREALAAMKQTLALLEPT